jgi:hypothetical protein
MKGVWAGECMGSDGQGRGPGTSTETKEVGPSWATHGKTNLWGTEGPGWADPTAGGSDEGAGPAHGVLYMRTVMVVKPTLDGASSTCMVHRMGLGKIMPFPVILQGRLEEGK